MKNVLVFALLLFALNVSAQEEKPCPQFPIANPDAPAVFDAALNDSISAKLPATLDRKSAREGVFKLKIDCKGGISGVVPQDQIFSSKEVEAIKLSIREINWVPAENEGSKVTSTYFLKIAIDPSGKVTVSKA